MSIAEDLVRFGVSTLHEANARRQLLHRIQLMVGPVFAGPAVTVELAAGDNLGVHLAVDAARPGDVLCIASAGQGLYGVIGELLLESMRSRGIAGIVIDDGIRDVADLLPPPSVAALGQSPLGTVKRRMRRRVGSPIALAGTLVFSRDWVACDQDGACVVPASSLPAVLEAAHARRSREEAMLVNLKNGATTSTLMSLSSPTTDSFPPGPT